MKRCFVACVARQGLIACLAWSLVQPIGQARGADDAGKATFGGPGGALAITRDAHVDYSVGATPPQVQVGLPKGVKPDEACGLIVFVSPDDEAANVPLGWEPILDRAKLIFASPAGAGNDHPTNRRAGLAVVTALGMMSSNKIDPARVYSAGFSGGARIAGQLGFYQSDVFKGTIQCCGADFPAQVPQVAPRSPKYANDADYGRIDATTDEIAAAKANVRFALITGSEDFRHGFIADVFHGGFEKDGFNATLIDVPGLSHAEPTGRRFAEALAFIERQPTDTLVPPNGPAPTPTPWAAKPTAQWPQLLLENEYQAGGGGGFSGASGFLVQLPSGQVLAVTARHVFGDGFDPAELTAAKTVWAMVPHGKKSPTIRLRKVAWDTAAMAGDHPLDCVAMSVDPQAHYPAEPLLVRETPAEPGETVYLLGVPYGEKSAQNVYKGTVTEAQGPDGQFGYEIEGTPETRGFSGAPVVDANGHVLGIHHGRFNNPKPGKTHATAVDMSAVLPALRPPPGWVTPRQPATPAAGQARQTPARAPVVPPAAPDASADEVAAGHALDMAQNYVQMKRYPTAKAKLQAIITKYPKTTAAKRAQAALKALPTDDGSPS